MVRAIRGVSLSIAPGEMIAFEGPSGSGKSTLLQLLGCLEVPTAGQLHFFGREVANLSDTDLTEIRAHEIGFVFQQFNLIPTLSATENVVDRDGAEQGAPAKERAARARELLERVGLGHRFDHLPLAHVRWGATARRDRPRRSRTHRRSSSPTSRPGNLDSETAAEVMALISELHSEQKVTVIVATHDEEIARERRTPSADPRRCCRRGLDFGACLAQPPGCFPFAQTTTAVRAARMTTPV